MEQSSQETNESHKLLSALRAIHNVTPLIKVHLKTHSDRLSSRFTFTTLSHKNTKNKYMSVEKYYFRQTVVCQKKQHNSLDNTHSLSHLLHFHDLDLAAPVALSPQSIFSTLLCTFNA